jgi:hypothetical protein
MEKMKLYFTINPGKNDCYSQNMKVVFFEYFQKYFCYFFVIEHLAIFPNC